MKVLILVGLALVSVACGQKLPGTIESYSKTSDFGTGEASLLVKEKDDSSDNELVLQTNRGTWKFKLPKSLDINTREFNITSLESGQKIRMVLSRQVDIDLHDLYKADFLQGTRTLARFTARPIYRTENQFFNHFRLADKGASHD